MVNVGFSQLTVDKVYSPDAPQQGGDAILKRNLTTAKGDYGYRIFEVDAPDDGDYYLSAWIMASEKGIKVSAKDMVNFKTLKPNPDSLTKYWVEVNDISIKGTLNPSKSNWAAVNLCDHNALPITVKLNKGLNTISLISPLPEIPNSSYIRLAKSLAKSTISTLNYDNFVQEIKKEDSARINNPQTIVIEDTLKPKNQLKYELDDKAEYDCAEALTCKYTTWRRDYFTASQVIDFSTYSTTQFDHVIEVFYEDDPVNHSWVDRADGMVLPGFKQQYHITDIIIQGYVHLSKAQQVHFICCI